MALLNRLTLMLTPFVGYPSWRCCSWPPVWIAVSPRLAWRAGLSAPLLWLTVRLCLCEESVRSWEVTSCVSWDWQGTCGPTSTVTLSPLNLHTGIHHTLKCSVWCGKAVQPDPSPCPCLNSIIPPANFIWPHHLLSAVFHACAAYSLLLPSIGTRAYSSAEEGIRTRPRPPQGQKS